MLPSLRIKTTHRSLPGLQRLAALLFITLVSLGWQSVVQGQTPAQVRCSDSLTLKEIDSGIEYGQTSCGQATSDDTTGPWFINALRIDLAKARIKVVHALDEAVGVETVSSLASRHRATAATNGGYFQNTGPYLGDSVGLLLLDGQLLSEPYNERAAVGFFPKGNRTEIRFGHLRFSGEIRVGAAKQNVHGLNRPVLTNELIVYTPAFHRTTLTNADGVEVVVRGNRIVSVNDLSGSTEIPSDGYVVSAVGKSRQWIKRYLRKGARVTFNWRLHQIEPGGSSDWIKAESLLGGGPQLIKDGKVAITVKEEKMRATFDVERHPRTAIAKLRSGKVLLVTVDGRQPGVSAGMSLYRLSDFLLEFDAVDAINLDGGGSTTMVIHNKVVNRPSDQTGERPVSDAILVFPK